MVLATDTVYGLVASPDHPAAIARIYALKERPRSMPLALLAGDNDSLLAALPELDARTRRAVTSVLPGPYTLVVSAAGSRYDALGADGTESIGIRVPRMPEAARCVLDHTGPLASTSANLHGATDPATVGQIPLVLRSGVDAVVNEGRLLGTPSTVVDLTSEEPRVLREGAVSCAVAVAALSGL